MNILVCIDFSETTEIIIKKATELAAEHAAKLWLIHVTSPDQGFVGYEPASLAQAGPLSYHIETQSNSQPIRNYIAHNLHKKHQQIQHIANLMRQKNLDATALLIQGTTVKTILQKATTLGADMVIIGSHGRSKIYQLLLGSVSEEVIHQAKCPVLVVPLLD